jgi:hypothetical protein
MFKRKINLKKARKLADCVPEGLRLKANFLSEERSTIVNLDIPVFNMNSLNRNNRRYSSLNDKSTW